MNEPAGTVTSLQDHASVEGGGAPQASRDLPIPINGEVAGFGVESFELSPFNEDGTPAAQAGAHPFQLTTTLVLNQTGVNDPEGSRYPVKLPKDFAFHLPPGFIGNPNAVKQCTIADFAALVSETNLCGPDTVVGVATVSVHEPLAGKFITVTVPVFNLVPAQGEPARFGFEVIGKVPIVIDTSVRTGRDYGVDVSVKNATQTAGVLSSVVTFWGVPGDPRHNNARGWECVAGGFFAGQAKRGPCPATSAEPEEPFLTLPGSCAANPQEEPIVSGITTDSWADPGTFLDSEYAWVNGSGHRVGLQGCAHLPFEPSINVVPEQHAAATPTGVDVTVKVPQKSTLEPNGLAEANVRDTVVTLPAGVELSPSAANGLGSCSEAEIGFEGLDAGSQTELFSGAEASCPEASKVGTVSIRTPLLTHELEGAVVPGGPGAQWGSGEKSLRLACGALHRRSRPGFGRPRQARRRGVLDEGTLRVSTVFSGTPQVPFEELRLRFVRWPSGVGEHAGQVWGLSPPTRRSRHGPAPAQSRCRARQKTSGSPKASVAGRVRPRSRLQPGFTASEHESAGRRFTPVSSRN